MEKVERKVAPMTEAEHRLLGRLRSMASNIVAEEHIYSHGHVPSPNPYGSPPSPQLNLLIEALREIVDERIAAALVSKNAGYGVKK